MNLNGLLISSPKTYVIITWIPDDRKVYDIYFKLISRMELNKKNVSAFLVFYCMTIVEINLHLLIMYIFFTRCRVEEEKINSN